MSISKSKPAQLISTTTAAKRLNVAPNTIRRFIVEKKLTGYNIGRSIKVDAQSVEDFIANNVRES